MKFAAVLLVALVAIAAQAECAKVSSKLVGSSDLVCFIKYFSKVEKAVKKVKTLVEDVESDYSSLIDTIKDCDLSVSCIVEALESADVSTTVIDEVIDEVESVYTLYEDVEKCLK